MAKQIQQRRRDVLERKPRIDVFALGEDLRTIQDDGDSYRLVIEIRAVKLVAGMLAESLAMIAEDEDQWMPALSLQTIDQVADREVRGVDAVVVLIDRVIFWELL